MKRKLLRKIQRKLRIRGRNLLSLFVSYSNFKTSFSAVTFAGESWKLVFYHRNGFDYMNKIISSVAAIDGKDILLASSIYDSHLQQMYSTISTKKN